MPMSRFGAASRSAALTPLALVAALFALLLVLAGCTIPLADGMAGETTPNSETPTAPAPATLELTPADGATDVAVVDGVSATVADGTITGAVLTNDAGKVIDGTLSPDRTAWTPAVTLGYGRDYTLAVTYEGAAGGAKTEKRSFSMVAPQSVLTPSLVSAGGVALESGREYGVGIIVGARFDQPVADRDAVEEHLRVSTEPAVEGNWFWLDDSTAHWRPEEYYAPGTKVSVELETEGRNLGGGQYGGESAEVDFRIGTRRVAIADDVTKTVTVYHDQKPVRVMNTSMGQGGWATYGGTSMHFWTQPGTYTVFGKEPSVIMDSSSYGLPVDDPFGYRETILSAVRISTNGIYLHRLDDTTWAQGNTNVSHGCLNLNAQDSAWYFDQAVAGDVVEVRNTGGPELEVWKGGDWSVPWSTWQQGSAD